MGLKSPAMPPQSWDMTHDQHRFNWSSLARLEDARIPLLSTALLIARDEYPQLDLDHYDALMHHYAQQIQPRIQQITSAPLKMAEMNRYLFEELGFRGNSRNYYDPRNSYLNEVFDRRLGNPLSLAILQMELARRVGMHLEGISFPGQFLVRISVEEGVLVMDPFNGGRPLDLKELRERAQTQIGRSQIEDETLVQILQPASHRAILMRILRNLHAIYGERQQWEKVVRCADRLLKLLPDQPDVLRDRGLAYLQLGYRSGAREDLDRYLQMYPRANDAADIRDQLVQLANRTGFLH